ncbi:MAG: C-GCAxxG-C-C family protein [Methanomassiliicoccaceae archaeon]|jgi:C_GCAxxG_C_C family probable redox protein|nr:C-GCAxxG-C-C family protein [Methanomassiliicoccaceae archaeon]
MLTDEYVQQKFREGIDCSMMVLAEVAARIGISEKEAYRTASCFGAGMFTGGVCGAVTGAFIAIGIKHGNHEPNDTERKMKVISKRDEFVRRFTEIHGSVDCPVLLGIDLRDNEQRQYARDNGLFDNECPKFCRTAALLLKDIL